MIAIAHLLQLIRLRTKEVETTLTLAWKIVIEDKRPHGYQSRRPKFIFATRQIAPEDSAVHFSSFAVALSGAVSTRNQQPLGGGIGHEVRRSNLVGLDVRGNGWRSRAKGRRHRFGKCVQS